MFKTFCLSLRSSPSGRHPAVPRDARACGRGPSSASQPLFSSFTQFFKRQTSCCSTRRTCLWAWTKWRISTFVFFLYTVLQAADILLFHATHVPVGVDQVAHLNLTNSLREDFNRVFKEDYFSPGRLYSSVYDHFFHSLFLLSPCLFFSSAASH